MDTRLQNQAKASSLPSVSPVQTGLFQPRPFTDSEQEAAEASDLSHQPPNLQTQLQPASRFGHNFSRVQVQTNTPAAIQTQLLNRQPEEQQDEEEANEVAQPIKMMAPPVGEPIERESSEEPIQMMPQLGLFAPVIQRQEQEEEPIQAIPQWGMLQRLPAEEDDLPMQMMPQWGVIQRQESEAEEEPIQMKWLQPKLVVGAPGDKYEQEADSVAAQVMSMSLPVANPGLVQRQGEEEQEQEPLVQRSPLADSITPLVQRLPEEQEEPLQAKSLLQRAANGNAVAGSNVESQLNSSKGGGSPLPDEVRSFMEPRFGADFSQVRVHTDSTAVQMNKELRAQAFAHGSDIYYGAGKSPGKDALTAHELTHTIQQGGAVRLNKEVRRQPQPEEQEKEQLQAKQLDDRIPETAPNKELRLQPIEEQEEAEPLQAKQLGDRIPETAPNKELRLQPIEEQEEAEPLQAKQLDDRTPEVSSNKELRLQPIEEQEEAEPLQAKQLGDRTPEVPPNKELRLQPLEEQEEAEPLQAKELPSQNPELSLNKELQRQPLETANPVIQAKALEGGFTPSPLSIQRGIGDLLSKGWNKTKDVVGAGIERGGDLLSKGKDLLKSGLDWVKNNIIQPLMRLGSSGWSAVKNFGSQISTTFKQANPTIWDVFQPEHLMFRMASNQRQQLFAQAIQAERSQQAQAAAGIQSSGPAPVTEPSQLQRLNGLAETVESGAGKVFDIKKELLEGAVVGDFKENPTIWNTIGQVAIGFVPYAGQVADIRDIIANVKKLHEGGYKDPDAWINLGLTAIGIIPGVGDIIKAAGKGSKGVIRKALSGVLKNADNILRPVLGKAKGLLNGAGRYGKQFLGWASGQGAKLLQGVKGFAQKTANFAKAAGQRARGLVTALNSRIGGFVNGAMQKASAVVSQGRGLMGKAISQFMGMARQAFDAVQSRVSQGLDLVKAAAQRGKDVALKVGRKIADTTQKATTLLREFTQSAIQKGRQAVQKARQWSSQQIKKATEIGRNLVKNARDRVASLVRQGVKLAKEKAIPFIKQKLGGVKQRIKNFLQDKWNRLKEKLGIKKPGKEGPKGGAKETPDTASKKAAELPAAIAQAKAITKANDAVDTPVPALIGVLNASVKSKYSWIKRFEARPKAVPGHYSIYLIASQYHLGDYTTRPGAAKGDLASELGVSSERIEHALKVLSPEEVRRLHGDLGQDLFETLASPKRNPNVIRNFSRALELAAGDSVARKEILEILRLAKKGSVSGVELEKALSQLVPFMERYQGRISGDFASRFRRAVQKNDPVQAEAEIRLAEDILEGRTPLGRESSVEGLPDRSREGRQTPEYRATGSGSGDRLVEVKNISDPLAEEGIKRNVKKAISQIKEQAQETFETGGFIRIDASPSPSTTMTQEEIRRAVKGQLWFTPPSGKPGKQFVEWVEVLYNDAKGSRTVRFRVQGDDLIISP